MATISNLIFPPYYVLRGKNSLGEGLDYEEAQNNAKIFLIEAFKVSVAIGGFFAVTGTMAMMATPLTVYGTGILLLSGAYLITKRFSPLLHDATKITIGIALIKIVCYDQAVKPLIETIRATRSYVATIQVGISVPDKMIPMVKDQLQTLGIGFLRFMGGTGSLIRGVVYILDDPKKQTEESRDGMIYVGPKPKPEYLIDNFINGSADRLASLIVRLRGYRKPTKEDEAWAQRRVIEK